MTKKILACCLTFGLFAAAHAAPVAEMKAKVKAEPAVKTGVIEVVKADAVKKEKYDTVLLKVGKETIKLLPGRDKDSKKLFKKLEALGGKEVTVTGELKPANLPKYPLAAILVDSFVEKSATAPAAAPAPGKK